MCSDVEEHYFFNEDILGESIRDVEDCLIEIQNWFGKSKVDWTKHVIRRVFVNKRRASWRICNVKIVNGIVGQILWE